MPEPDTAAYLSLALCGALALVAEGLWGLFIRKGWK